MKKILYLTLSFPVIFFILCIPSSCKKTVTRTVIDTVRHAWQPLPIYNINGVPALSSFNVGDTTLTIGGNFAFVQVPVNRSSFNFISSYLLPGTSLVAPAYEAPFLDAAAGAYTTGASLFVTSVPRYSQYSLMVYTPVFTPGTYSVFQQQCTYPSQSSPATDYPIIRNKYLLTPVEAVGNSNQQTRFDLLSFDSAKVLSPNGFGDTLAVKSFIVTAAPGTPGFSLSNYFCASYYGKFFVSYGGQFLRIDTLGNVRNFGYSPAPYSKSYGIANMFTVGNTLYVNSGGIIYGSVDQGENWSVINDFSNSASGGVVYRNVGTDLYATEATLESQIWKVVVNGNNFSFSEINTDGLEYNLLTSLTRCGRYVFVTTPTGVFYRDTTYFNQLKTPVR
jgi:hypothetical protein